MYCIECGKELFDGAKFCAFCGADVKKQAKTEAVLSEGAAESLEALAAKIEAFTAEVEKTTKEIDAITEQAEAEQEAEVEKEIDAITEHNINSKFIAVVAAIFGFPIFWVAIYIWNWVDMIFNDADYYGGWTISLWALVISIAIAVIIFLSEYFKSDREKVVDIQFQKDQTSICPRCGGHNIKIYRNGYEWNKGFWYRLFDVKGGHYAAGMKSNRARCRCLNCGNDWLTDYDYRLIKK